MGLCKVKAMLFIAVQASANPVLQSTRFGYANRQMNVKANAAAVGMMMTQPSLQEEAQFVHNKIDAMLSDQRIMGKAKRVAKQMEALMALPNVQEQVKVFAENVELSMKPVTENMEAMQAGDAKFQEAFEQVKVFAENVELSMKPVT